ncbi:MAG: hypothetical protein ABIP51_01295 [Bacteroidia bacterium]
MKNLLILIVLAISFSSCKKKDPTPAPSNTPTVTASSLPDNYVILNDGSITDTLSMTVFIPSVIFNTDTNSTYKFSACPKVNGATNCNLAVAIFLRLPTDSVRLANFPLSTYGTGTVNTSGFAVNNTPNGILGFERDYTTGSFLSVANTSTITYNNKILSITRIKTEYNIYSQTNCATYTIKGQFSIHCQSTTSTTKDYTGTYRLKLWSNNKFW